MRIFISHSSKDKWAARRIAKDVEELGHEVFLDEKDIVTGDAIDTSIRNNLKKSDHFLLLLSPASLNSSWVLVELGGAIALEKRIVPILLYVGANEVPQVINLKLARDINDIDKYYDELGGLPKPPKAAAASFKAKKPPRPPPVRPFSVGDTVLIARSTPKTIVRREGVNVRWVDEMDRYVGKSGKVTEVDRDGDCMLDVSEPTWIWAPEWLQRVSPKVA
jgi:hypothetical protein